MAKRASKKAPAPAAQADPVPQGPVAVIRSAEDLVPDRHNANLGSERGGALLQESLDRCGAGRSILADRNGQVIAGNKTLARAMAKGMPVEVVQTTGHELVVVQRTDLDLGRDRRARQLAYYDNRVSQLDLTWSPTQVQTDLSAGIDLSVAFFPSELAMYEPPAPKERKPKAEASEPTAAPEQVAAVAEPVAPPPGAVDLSEAVPMEAPATVYAEVKLRFAGTAQRLRWLGFIRILNERYPEVGLTAAQRLSRYLTEVGIA